MSRLLQPFGRLRLAALALGLLPGAVLLPLGLAWLWQSPYGPLWLALAAICVLASLLLNVAARRREQAALPPSSTTPAGHWSPRAETCWKQVQARADAARPEDWPLGEGGKLLELARQILVDVATHYHPEAERPLLEMTLPHTLAIIERAARGLREDIAQTLPFSHQLSLGTLVRAQRWGEFLKRHEGWLRAGRALLSPQTAMVSELRRAVGNQLLDEGSQRVRRWLLREYILKIGFHAIELYGGYARIDEARPPQASDAVETEPPAQPEPLRILVLGRANAGKSSLVNALLGGLHSPVDVLAGSTPGAVDYRLDSGGDFDARIVDTPPLEQLAGRPKALGQLAAGADLLLWVSAATQPDRSEERIALDELRAALAALDHPAVPLLVAMSQIDRLRPMREWQPPYRLDPPEGEKAKQIVAAAGALAADLAVPAEDIIPVCLAEGRSYNVDDALWAALLARQPQARRLNLLRCLRARQREEDWSLLWTQLRGAGRLLRGIAGSLRG